MRRRQLVQLAAAAAATPLAAFAQGAAFPNRPIRLMIAFPAGGPTDITMRQLADNAAKHLGQPVVVENRPGAGGALPAQQLQTSPADGYTLAQIPLGVFRLPYTTKINWDPVKDISYILNVTGYAFGIVVPADGPIKTWADFVAYAKANPGRLTYGSTGTLTSPHLTTELIAQQLGLQLTHVPYKGVAASLTDVMSGEVQGTFASAPSVMGQIKAGQVRPIAVSATKRSAALPDVPTFAEAGLPALALDAWFAFFVPSGTPDALTKQIHAEINKVLEDPAVVAQFASKGASPMKTSLGDFQKIVDKDMAQWGQAVKDSGAKID